MTTTPRELITFQKRVFNSSLKARIVTRTSRKRRTACNPHRWDVIERETERRACFLNEILFSDQFLNKREENVEIPDEVVKFATLPHLYVMCIKDRKTACLLATSLDSSYFKLPSNSMSTTQSTRWANELCSQFSSKRTSSHIFCVCSAKVTLV